MNCAKGFLLFFNCIFWLLGAALMGVAVWFLLDNSISDKLIVLEFNRTDRLTSYALYLMVATGGFMFLVGFFGCCGALREDRVCLGLYMFFVLIAFLAEVAALIMAALHRSKLRETAMGQWRDVYKKYYNPFGDRPYNLFTQAMNGIQYDLDCCGVQDYRDFKLTAAYVKNLTAPATCCRKHPSASRSDPRARNQRVCNDEINEQSSTTSYTGASLKELHDQGCFNPTIVWLQRYSYILIGVCAGVAFVEIFVILLAACLCRTIRYYK